MLTPNDLFSRYTKFLPLLSPNTLIWLFNLVILFFNALTRQEVVRLGSYILSNLLQLITSFSQEQVLQILREHAIKTFKALTEEKPRIRRTVTTYNHGRGTSQILLVDYHNSSSNIEKTIEYYTNSDALSNFEISNDKN